MRKMTKTDRRSLIFSTLLCFIPFVIGAVLYGKLPEQIPVHFNAAGEADGFASKFPAVFGLPAFMLLMHLIVHFAITYDPKYDGKGGAIVAIGKYMIPVLSIAVTAFTLGYSLGIDMNIEKLLPLGIGVLLLVIGNYLPKCKQSYTVGIKLPWTLSSEENWNKTHRFAGYVWTIGAILFILFSLFGLWGPASFAIAVLVIIPMVYSFILYKKGI